MVFLPQGIQASSGLSTQPLWGLLFLNNVQNVKLHITKESRWRSNENMDESSSKQISSRPQLLWWFSKWIPSKIVWETREDGPKLFILVCSKRCSLDWISFWVFLLRAVDLTKDVQLKCKSDWLRSRDNFPANKTEVLPSLRSVVDDSISIEEDPDRPEDARRSWQTFWG